MGRKDGKLFGKISIIDLAAILVVLVLIAGVAMRFSGNQAVSVSTGQAIECVVKVENVRMQTVNALQKGGAVFDQESKEYIGDITGVAEEPGTTMLLMENGEYREVPTEGRYNAYVTIAFTGSVSDAGYYTATNRQMSVGGTLEMNAKFSQCEGKIFSVRQVENQ